MSDKPSYPYKARSLMRFQAQDGQFVINANQVVTVTQPTENVAEWLDVTDEQGASGTIPAGFLIPIEEEIHQENESQPAIAEPSGSQAQAASDEPLQSKHHPPPSRSNTSASIENPPTAVPNVSSPHEFSQASSSLPANQTLPPLTSVASHASSSSQISAEPATPSKGPPTPAAKSNALRDRIAMFNKTGPTSASPPPNVRPKPQIVRKTIPAPVPPIQSSQEPLAPSSASHEDEIARSNAQAGMSAADAEESVKASGSLKDRIRLLTQQQQATAPESTSTPPKPKREWKRPPAPPADESAAPISIGLPPSIQHETSAEGEEPSSHPAAEPEPSSHEENPEQVDDEEEELARRRRIAERMAKLGGAKMGFGFPGPAIGPKPTIPPKPLTDAETVTQPPAETAVEQSSSTLPPERISIPSIPKRAPPPRRKAPSPANVPAQSDPSLVEVSEGVTSSNVHPPPSLEDSMVQPRNNQNELAVPVQQAVSSPVNDLPNVSAPPEDAQLPAQGHSPTEELTTHSSHVDEMPTPPQRKAPSRANTMASSDVPLEVPVQPHEDPVKPLDDPPQPLDFENPPKSLDDPVQSLEDPVQSLDDPSHSLEHPAHPLEHPEQSLDYPTRSPEHPFEDPTQYSLNAPAKSPEDPVQSIEDSVQSGEDPVQSFEDPAQSVENPAQSLEDSTQALEDPAQFFEDPAQSTEPPEGPEPLLDDSMTPSMNQHQVIQVLPTEPASSAALDDAPNVNEISEPSPPAKLVNSPFSVEPKPSESEPHTEEVVEDVEEEMARRQRIAERMAKLGGAKIGFGFPGGSGMMAPRSSGSPKQQPSGSEALPTQPSPKESTTAEDLAAHSPVVRPVMPSRATPPTRKAPSPASMVPVSHEGAVVEHELQLENPKEPVSPHLVASVSHQVHDDHAPPAPPKRPAPVMSSDVDSTTFQPKE